MDELERRALRFEEEMLNEQIEEDIKSMEKIVEKYEKSKDLKEIKQAVDNNKNKSQKTEHS